MGIDKKKLACPGVYFFFRYSPEGAIMKKPGDYQDKTDFSVLLDLSRGADSRKRILKTLLLGSKNCSQIAKIVDLNWYTASRHIQILMKEGLVNGVCLGERRFYKLSQKGQEALESYREDNSC
jgi:predicted transcriptional regulator